MKRIKRLLIRCILVVSIFSITSITLSVSGLGIIDEANAAVGEYEARQYLINNGYEVLSLQQCSGSPGSRNSFNWIAHTIKNGEHFWTTVFCTATEVIGHGDSPY